MFNDDEGWVDDIVDGKHGGMNLYKRLADHVVTFDE